MPQKTIVFLTMLVMLLLTCSSCICAPYSNTPKAAWIDSEEGDFIEPDHKIVKELDTLCFGDVALYIFIDDFGEIVVADMFVKHEGVRDTYICVGASSFDLNILSFDFEPDSFSDVRNQSKVVFRMRLKDDDVIFVNGNKAETKVYQAELEGEMYDVELWYAHLGRDDEVNVSLKTKALSGEVKPVKKQQLFY